MLKHVQNTLTRRHNNAKDQGNRDQHHQHNLHQSSRPRAPSPAPSTISSCSSISSLGSTFFSSSSSSSSPNSSTTTNNNNDANNSNNNASNLSVLSGSTTVSAGSGSSSSGYSSSSISTSPTQNNNHHMLIRRGSLSLSLEDGPVLIAEAGSWTRTRRRSRTSLAECSSIASSMTTASRAGSRLSINSSCSTTDQQGQDGKLIPLRIYAACLRPDIQYKTVGVNHTTTCSQVIQSLLNKCKLRYKDPKLFSLTMELKIRNSVGDDVEASIPLEESTIPLQLQECYPRGQAKFSLKMNTAESKLVKVYDETGMLGWQYKSIMISEKSTAGELIGILFRFSSITNVNNSTTTTGQVLNTSFMLFLEVNDNWSQRLDPNDLVIPMKIIVATQVAENDSGIKLVLRSSKKTQMVQEEHSSSSSSCTQQFAMLSPPSPFKTYNHNRLSQPMLKSFNMNRSISDSGNGNGNGRSNSSSNRNSVVSLYENVSSSSNTSTTGTTISKSHITTTSNNNGKVSSNDSSPERRNNNAASAREYWRRRRSKSLSSSSGESSSIQSTSKDSVVPDECEELLKAFSLSCDLGKDFVGRNNNSHARFRSKYEFFV